ncbi:MAG: hypothetical protein NTX45_25950 [Proteobacteria bacterium]|nr:hypothetical protein [Pseudomonadota bacterium]
MKHNKCNKTKSPITRRERIRQLYGQIKTGKSTDEIMRLLRE